VPVTLVARKRHIFAALGCAAVLLALVLTARSAAAQPRPRRTQPSRFTIRLEDADPSLLLEQEAERLWLRDRTGVRRGSELLVAPSIEARVRGIDRLAVDGSDEAVDALVEAMAVGSAVRTSSRTRLAAVRALAAHADDKEVHKILMSVLFSTPAAQRGVRDGASESELDSLARATAAMALARNGKRAAMAPLISAVIQGGLTGKVAREALLAQPPRSIRPLVHGYRRHIAPSVISLIGDLGDPRAIGVLRQLLTRKRPAVRAAAVIALAKLGDVTAARSARRWLTSARPHPAVRVAAVEALLWLDAHDTAKQLSLLLGDAKTRGQALRLAEMSLSPALVPTLLAVAKAPVPTAERARATAIIGRIGGAKGSAALLGLLSVPELATSAAFGLAATRDSSAGLGLARALASADEGPARRLILRAAVVRYLQLGHRIAGLSAALSTAYGSDEQADRAVGAFGLAVLAERTPAELAKSKHPEVVHAFARAALALGPEALSALAGLLPSGDVGTHPSTVQIAAGLALLSEPDVVATSLLARWSEGGGVLAPLSSMRLAARDSKRFRERLVRLLAGSDPLVRAGVARGLGESPEKDAVALLADAYRFEAEPMVRRAIIKALASRNELRREATFRLARELDPDPAVRAMAAAALAGRKLQSGGPPRGKQVAWVALRANRASEKQSVGSRPAQLVRADGLSLPVVSDPDGVLLVPGLSDVGHVALRLAPESDSDNPSAHAGQRSTAKKQ